MAVINRNNLVLNVVSVDCDVVTDNKSMVRGTAKPGHALAVHFTPLLLTGYQRQQTREQASRECASSRGLWSCWRQAKQSVSFALAAATDFEKPSKSKSRLPGKTNPRPAYAIGIRSTERTPSADLGLAGRMSRLAPLA
jgi:hypothetical protein